VLPGKTKGGKNVVFEYLAYLLLSQLSRQCYSKQHANSNNQIHNYLKINKIKFSINLKHTKSDFFARKIAHQNDKLSNQ
jgi:hypothetical protein